MATAIVRFDTNARSKLVDGDKFDNNKIKNDSYYGSKGRNILRKDFRAYVADVIMKYAAFPIIRHENFFVN